MTKACNNFKFMALTFSVSLQDPPFFTSSVVSSRSTQQATRENQREPQLNLTSGISHTLRPTDFSCCAESEASTLAMRPLPSSFAFFAALAVTCPSVASSSGSPPRFSRSCDSDLAFCAPMSSPRCFRSRPATALGEFSAPAGVAKGPRTTQIEAQTLYCGPSLDDLDTGADTSGACAPKKHLGPTVEEITVAAASHHSPL